MGGDAIARWRAAGEAGDARMAGEALAEDAELVSPLTDRFVFGGREEIVTLLGVVFAVYAGIRYTGEFRDGDRAILLATGRIGGRTLEETQHLELDAEGRIRRVTLAMRPLPAVTAFLRALGPRLALAQGRPGLAAALRPAGGLLHAVAASGDKTFMPLADPARGLTTLAKGAGSGV